MATPRPDPVSGIDALELRHLRHFVAVADARSFTRAADELHLAQQALSASIRRLEALLGVALFARTTRRVELTAAGEALLEPARATLAAAADAVDRVRLVRDGRSGRLTIGFSTAAGGVGVVREILRRAATAAPEVDLRTVEHDFADPSAGLAEGRTQVAFIFGPPPVEGLASLTLLEEPRLVALPPEHALAGRASVTLDDLGGLPWLQVPAPDGPWPEDWFPRRPGVPVGPVIRTADEWVTAIEAGRGVAFTMPSVMRNFATARLVVLPVLDAPPARLLLAWRVADADQLVAGFVAVADRTARGGAAG